MWRHLEICRTAAAADLRPFWAALRGLFRHFRGTPPWHRGGLRLYASRMNEAVKPGPESPRKPSPQATGLPVISVVVPTFNERDNVTTLYQRLEATFGATPWEVVFVDDNSPDGTWQVVRELSQKDARVRCIRRIGRRGLSGACIEGILASSAPYAAVIDADLQHDETQLPKMLALLQSGRGGARDRQPVRRGRQRRQFQQAARRRQRACHRSRQAHARRQGRRSHERLLRDPPRPFRAAGAASFRRKASRSCSTSSQPPAANCAPRKFPSPSARGCMARASSIPWWRSISSAWCWRNSLAT